MHSTSSRLAHGHLPSYGTLEACPPRSNSPERERLFSRSCTFPPLLILSLVLLFALLSAFLGHHFLLPRDHSSHPYFTPTSSAELGAIKERLVELERRVWSLERRAGEAHLGAREERAW
ncbi:hypothetical protein JCM8547_007898 [Rhodosporidiobolus lusitaniae]